VARSAPDPGGPGTAGTEPKSAGPTLPKAPTQAGFGGFRLRGQSARSELEGSGIRRRTDTRAASAAGAGSNIAAGRRRMSRNS